MAVFLPLLAMPPLKRTVLGTIRKPAPKAARLALASAFVTGALGLSFADETKEI